MLKLGKKKGDKNAEAQLPAVTEGDAPEVEGEEGAPKKKKIPLLFIIIPAVVLVLAGGGVTAFLLMKPKPAAVEGEHGAAEEKDDHGKAEKKGGGGHGEAKGGEAAADGTTGTISDGPDGVTFYSLPDMVVNIQSPDGRPTLLKLKLTLEMHDADVAAGLQADFPRLKDMFQAFLRELRTEDLSGSAGTYQLRVEILRRVNMLAAPGKVDAVLIEEMLVQ